MCLTIGSVGRTHRFMQERAGQLAAAVCVARRSGPDVHRSVRALGHGDAAHGGHPVGQLATEILEVKEGSVVRVSVVQLNAARSACDATAAPCSLVQ